ncbi:MAG: hypothetical protein Q4B43_10915 [Bacteroidota bacterium]|nr:hypothetical protein [Bacteroidota bacterium]
MSTIAKKTTKKKTALAGAVKTERKKLTKKQLDFITLTKKAQEMLSKLYREGRIDVYDPVR